MQMGLREANQHFSKAINAVRAGEDVVLTERGRPIAVIKPFRKSQAETTLQRLRAAGLLRAASKPKRMPPFATRRLKGVPITTTLREERNSS